MRDHDEHIRDLMKKIREQRPLKDRLLRSSVRGQLEDIFGKQAMDYITDLHVRNEVLTLYISSSTFRHELQMSLDLLLEKINDSIDGGRIKEIHLR